MRICFFADAAHYNTLNWAGYFDKYLNHDVHIVSFRKPHHQPSNVTVHHIPAKPALGKLRYLMYISYATKKLASIKPDILIGYRIPSYGFLAANTGFQPLVLAGQGQFVVWPKNNTFKRFFARFAISKASLIHSWANHMTQDLIKHGAPKESILTLPRGIDTRLFNNLRNPTTSNNSNILKIITTRALRKHYNIDIVIRALAIIVNQGFDNVSLSICGDGDHKDSLISLAKTLNIQDKVSFHGGVPNHELPKYLNRSDYYVSTVSTDGVSCSLLEAMSCSVFPIVVDNIANRHWIRHGINGYLYKQKDYQSLAEMIIYLCSTPRLAMQAKQINPKIVQSQACIHKNMNIFESKYLKLIASPT